jgi:long-chain fatty acid transport protein
VLVVAVVWSAGAARADDTHYQDILVGGRAIGLGGAYTSIADDPSGPFYNPAGLADARSANLQVSTSLYGFEQGSTNASVTPVPGADNLRFQFTDLIIIPASAGFVQTFGPLDEERHPYQAVAVSVVVPSYRSYAVSSQGVPDTSSPTGVTSTTHERRMTDRELWSGIGYGRRVTSDLRLGVSGYYILRSLTDHEVVTQSKSLSSGQGDKFQSVTDDVAVLDGSVVFIAGARWTPTERLAFGAALSSPSVPVHSQVSLAFSRASADPTSTSGQTSTLQNLSINARSEQRWAPSARLGASYSSPYKFTISADASYHLPVSYSLIAPNAADQPAYDGIKSRLPFNPDVTRKGVLNFNLGAEFLIIREVSIAGGFFTDFTSAPDIPENPSKNQPPHVNLFGMSMSIGYFGTHTLSRVGLLYSFGSGSSTNLRCGANNQTCDVDRVLSGAQDFNKSAYSQSFFYVFLSSTFRY